MHPINGPAAAVHVSPHDDAPVGQEDRQVHAVDGAITVEVADRWIDDAPECQQNAEVDPVDDTVSIEIAGNQFAFIGLTVAVDVLGCAITDVA